MSNTDSQDELKKQFTKAYKQRALANFRADGDTVAYGWDANYLWRELIEPMLNAHTQKAVTEARIDELEAVRQNAMQSKQVMGVVGSITNRIATLTNQPNRSKE